MTEKNDKRAEHEHEERIAVISAARDVGIMLALIGGAVAMALTDQDAIATTLAGGALVYAVPSMRERAPKRVPLQIIALAVGLGAGAMVSGCGASTPKVVSTACDAARVTCAAIDATCRVATAGSETP